MIDEIWKSRLTLYKTQLLEKYATNTVKAYLRDCQQLLDFMESHSRLDFAQGGISKEIAEKFWLYLHEKGYKPTTLVRKLDSLMNLGHFLVQQKHMEANPFNVIPYPKIKREMITPLVAEEVIGIIDSHLRHDFIGDRDRAILALLYNAGLKLSQLANLKRSEMSISTVRLTISESGRRKVVIPYKPGVREILISYLGARKILQEDRASKADNLILNSMGNKITARSIGRIVKQHLRSINGKGKFSSHSLRSSFIHHLLEAQVETGKVRKLAATKSYTAIYYYIYSSNKRPSLIYRKRRSGDAKTRDEFIEFLKFPEKYGLSHSKLAYVLRMQESTYKWLVEREEFDILLTKMQSSTQIAAYLRSQGREAILFDGVPGDP